ncbi:MAG: hypothetical protein B7Y51_10010 [Burkholderiales bacterium 28-67-8]|nr:MAG: hypothetical protein B7Y51_10010 [Burkholderiales bacterium 28-67-8]
MAVPVQLKRCGMAVRLVVRAAGSPIDLAVDGGLVALIGKARDWFDRLRSWLRSRTRFGRPLPFTDSVAQSKASLNK